MVHPRHIPYLIHLEAQIQWVNAMWECIKENRSLTKWSPYMHIYRIE